MQAASDADPVERKFAKNEWLWNEVWTDDLSATSRSYQGLLGYVEAERMLYGVQYHYPKLDGKPRLGLIEKPSPAIGNTWVGYIRVPSVADVAAGAKALGGTSLMEPRPSVRNGKVAIIADPNGAGFVVQEWDL
jgi:predicted enzyme related to lactoylglutathione lyase